MPIKPEVVPIQDSLPDIAKQIESIEVAARDYRLIRDERRDLQEKENDKHEILLAAMKREKVSYYRTVDGFDCVLEESEKVKIRAVKG